MLCFIEFSVLVMCPTTPGRWTVVRLEESQVHVTNYCDMCVLSSQTDTVHKWRSQVVFLQQLSLYSLLSRHIFGTEVHMAAHLTLL